MFKFLLTEKANCGKINRHSAESQELLQETLKNLKKVLDKEYFLW